LLIPLGLLRGHQVVRPRRAGAVDQSRHHRKGLARRPEQLIRRVRRGDVEGQGLDAAGVLPAGRHRRRELVAIAADEHHPRPLPDQRPGDGETDAAAASGDDEGAPAEPELQAQPAPTAGVAGGFRSASPSGNGTPATS
jgi:hypothetical protein